MGGHTYISVAEASILVVLRCTGCRHFASYCYLVNIRLHDDWSVSTLLLKHAALKDSKSEVSASKLSQE